MLLTLLLTPCRRLALPAHTAPDQALSMVLTEGALTFCWHWTDFQVLRNQRAFKGSFGVKSQPWFCRLPKNSCLEVERCIYLSARTAQAEQEWQQRKAKKKHKTKQTKTPLQTNQASWTASQVMYRVPVHCGFPLYPPNTFQSFLSNRVQTFSHIQIRCKTFSGTRAPAAKSCCPRAALQAQPDSHLEPHTSPSSAQTHRGFMGFFRQD